MGTKKTSAAELIRKQSEPSIPETFNQRLRRLAEEFGNRECWLSYLVWFAKPDCSEYQLLHTADAGAPVVRSQTLISMFKGTTADDCAAGRQEIENAADPLLRIFNTVAKPVRYSRHELHGMRPYSLALLTVDPLGNQGITVHGVMKLVAKGTAAVLLADPAVAECMRTAVLLAADQEFDQAAELFAGYARVPDFESAMDRDQRILRDHRKGIIYGNQPHDDE